MKTDPEVISTPLTNMEIAPVVAPEGTEVVILVGVYEATVAAVPLKSTVGGVLKLVPLTVTIAPTAPLDGLNPVIVGFERMIKSLVLITVTPLTVTEIFPVVAPAGIIAVRLVGEAAVTIAVVVLNLTT